MILHDLDILKIVEFIEKHTGTENKSFTGYVEFSGNDTYFLNEIIKGKWGFEFYFYRTFDFSDCILPNLFFNLHRFGNGSKIDMRHAWSK